MDCRTISAAALGAGGIWIPVDGVLNGWAKLQLVVDWAAETAAVLDAAATEPEADAAEFAAPEDAVAIALLALLLPLVDAAAGTLEAGTVLPDDEAAATGVLTAWASTWDKAHRISKRSKRICG